VAGFVLVLGAIKCHKGGRIRRFFKRRGQVGIIGMTWERSQLGSSCWGGNFEGGNHCYKR